MNWSRHNNGLNKIFGATSFEYLNKMGFYPEPDEEGDYDDSLDEIHDEWDELSADEKADKIMEASGYDEEALMNALLQESYCFLQ